MTLSLNKPKLDNLANEIWKSAERLRGKFKAHEYQGVILPIIVIRRLECVLLAWRRAKAKEIRASRPDASDEQIAKLVKGIEKNPQQAPFSNSSEWTLASLCAEDSMLLEVHFSAYLNGFSPNVQSIIEHFNYRATVAQMVKLNRLAAIINQYKDLDVGPDSISNLEMGYVYEELLRRFSEQSGEEAGEHFTPREVIRLMVELLDIPLPTRHTSIYDPACGTGGMLSVAKEHLLDRAQTEDERKRVEQYVTLHGQELQPGNFAICSADLLIKQEKHAQVRLGNSLIPHYAWRKEAGDQLAGKDDRFDFMLSNPPFGVTWGGKDGYEEEAREFAATRYQAGMPRVNDGALLFLQTMLAKMKPAGDGGSRIAVVFNGSPLSNGDCGQGESEIRRWILEHDWLDAIVMLPDQLFYNTGISTYIWLLRNEKPEDHRGRVMLIDARKQYEKEPKSFGNKRNRITDANRDWIETRYRDGWAPGYQDDDVKLFKPADFAYHKVAVVFWQHDASDQPAIVTEPYEKAFSAQNIKKEQEFHDSDLGFRIQATLPDGSRTAEIEFTLKPQDSFATVWGDAARAAFESELASATQGIADKRSANKAVKQFIDRLRLDVVWTHRHYVQDDEYIPHGEDIEAFLRREIAKPIVRWKDGEQLGYEILPNKYFYRYQQPAPASDLLRTFRELEIETEILLKGLSV